MSDTFVHLLLEEGRLLAGDAPAWTADPATLAFLEHWAKNQALHIPGQPLAVDRTVMLAGLDIVHRAAWFFLHPEETLPEEAAQTWLPGIPRTPAEHFSGDLALRFLAGLWHRTQNRERGPLVHTIENILRRWPLSGVLTRIGDPPEVAADFAGHPGLGYLYAERLARNFRPNWMPALSAMPALEVVWQEKVASGQLPVASE